MTQTSSRPAHLPDYSSPPLDEVVLGIQFVPAQGYQQIRAGEVWALYKSDFPHVEECPPIPPSFETFGVPPGGPFFNFGLVSGALHDRFWFLSPEKSQLIQFQSDRLLHNWRKVGDRSNEYPRFEKMISNFENEAERLDAYFNGLTPQRLVCNQAEISYINHIPLTGAGGVAKASAWLRFLDFGAIEVDDISAVFRRVISSSTGEPTGRMICDVNTLNDPHGERKLVLTFTVRGAPPDTSISAAIEFLKFGREAIVQEFTARTTDSAQKAWGRIR